MHLKRLLTCLLVFYHSNHIWPHVNAVSAATSLGANSLCDGNPRIRRDWDLIDSSEKELFKQAVEESIDRGLYQVFRKYHVDLTSSIQSHETCAFALWHRRYLLALENMLRSLDPQFACVTVPYWNIMEHFRDQERELCDSIGNCARVVVDLGGTPINTESTRTYSEIEATGVLFAGRPISRLIDDDGQAGIVRSDLLLVEVPPSCAYRNLIDVYAT